MFKNFHITSLANIYGDAKANFKHTGNPLRNNRQGGKYKSLNERKWWFDFGSNGIDSKFEPKNRESIMPNREKDFTKNDGREFILPSGESIFVRSETGELAVSGTPNYSVSLDYTELTSDERFEMRDILLEGKDYIDVSNEEFPDIKKLARRIS